MGVTIDDARAIAATLPRSYEALVRDQVRFRVGHLVYAAFHGDDTIMGFAFPREEREAVRDYFQVEDETGARFWLYRGEDLSWHLHGLFA